MIFCERFFRRGGMALNIVHALGVFVRSDNFVLDWGP